MSRWSLPSCSRASRAGAPRNGSLEQDPDEAEAIGTVLTKRELEIFRRLPTGESNREIGVVFALSENTVKNHVASILTKLKLNNRIQAAVHAVRNGFGAAGALVAIQLLCEEASPVRGSSPRCSAELLVRAPVTGARAGVYFGCGE